MGLPADSFRARVTAGGFGGFNFNHHPELTSIFILKGTCFPIEMCLAAQLEGPAGTFPTQISARTVLGSNSTVPAALVVLRAVRLILVYLADTPSAQLRLNFHISRTLISCRSLHGPRIAPDAIF